MSRKETVTVLMLDPDVPYVQLKMVLMTPEEYEQYTRKQQAPLRNIHTEE
jgi:hypothetical protein